MTADNHLAPKQLKMFMTAREVLSEYQPLDGDREDVFSSRNGDFTDRSRTTGGMSNVARRTYVPHTGEAPTKFGPAMRTATPGPGRSHVVSNERTETDSQLWDRKYQEANRTPRGLAEEAQEDFGMESEQVRAAYPKKMMTPGGHTATDSDRMGGRYKPAAGYTDRSSNASSYEDTFEPFSTHPSYDTTLRESVLAKGVQAPIRLSTQFGDQGKPQVVGGHHRIAVMARDRPDTLMPVLHDESIQDARSDRNAKAGFGYT